MVKLLLDSGADPEKADAVGVTALETAIDRGREKVVARFIITGARPDARVEERIQELPVQVLSADGSNPWTHQVGHGYTKDPAPNHS